MKFGLKSLRKYRKTKKQKNPSHYICKHFAISEKNRTLKKTQGKKKKPKPAKKTQKPKSSRKHKKEAERMRNQEANKWKPIYKILAKIYKNMKEKAYILSASQLVWDMLLRKSPHTTANKNGNNARFLGNSSFDLCVNSE